MDLKRTQIYLEPEQHYRLKREANQKDISLSELIRQIVREHYKGNQPEENASIVGLGKSGKSDVSERHDRYLEEEIHNEREEKE